MKSAHVRLLMSAALIFLFAPAALFAREVEIVNDPPITLVAEAGAGKLYQVGEHRVLVMEGAPEEMGYQHGRLLADHIHRMMKEGYMPKALWGRGYSREYVNEQSERMEKHFPPEIIAELHGVVRGLHEAGHTDITYEDVRLGVTQAEILHFPPDGPPACSSFACWGRWTPDGRLLHGRNLDWNVNADAQDAAAILIWRPKGGIPFMMMGWAGGVGSVSGMNARGITIGEMTLPSGDATFDGLPLFLQMRLVLEKTDTLADAVAFFENCKRTTGWNFVIGDGKIPDARALETDAKYCIVYGPMDPKENDETAHWGMEDAVRRTNHPVGMDQLLRLAKAFGHRFNISVETANDIKALRPLLQAHNSWLRYEWMSREIERQPGAIDIPEAIRILATGPVYNPETLHAFVFDPKHQTAYVANAGNNPPVTATDRPFTRIDLKRWFE